MTFAELMVGTVFQCSNGRRLIKTTYGPSAWNCVDAEENDFHIPGESGVVIIKSAIQMGAACIRFLDERDAAEERRQIEAAKQQARGLAEASR